MSNQLVWAAALATLAQAQGPGVIAYTRAPDGGPGWPVEDIYTVRIGRPVPQALTSDGHSHHPSWSPDGKRILFIHDAALSTTPAYRETDDTRSHHATQLSVMLADGRHPRVLRVLEPSVRSLWFWRHHFRTPDHAPGALGKTLRR